MFNASLNYANQDFAAVSHEISDNASINYANQDFLAVSHEILELSVGSSYHQLRFNELINLQL